MAAKKQQSSDPIQILETLLKNKLMGPYIFHIRFPHFKNIQPNSCINFDFPVTALVGPNGCGKTSVLHALYGAPFKKSTGEYWFSTDMDPIKGKAPHRFIYGHWLQGEGKVVETRKARVGQSEIRRSEYWEPTRPAAGDKMDRSPFPASGKVEGQSTDRWNPAKRNLLYINFRSELSAFDKFFFFGHHHVQPTKTLRDKQERLKRDAKRLKKVFENRLGSEFFWGKKIVHENRILSDRELKIVCRILGKKYMSAQLVRHEYYGKQEGLSVRFTTSHATYSEAFAGSGELAVASLVAQLCDATNKHPYSLVLLDEPEVSLHPGAQERLLAFLMDEAIKGKHQIIFTTHAPGMIKHLPPHAIKVFNESDGGMFDVLKSCHPYAAFRRLGAEAPNKITILVEDRLAAIIVENALLSLDDFEQELFVVQYLPGGSDSYFSQRIPTLMLQSKHTYIFFDGDVQPSKGPYPDPSTIPSCEDATLLDKIKNLTKCGNIQIGADGGDDQNADLKSFELQRKYLSFLYNRVRFLPRRCPEEIVLQAIEPDSIIETSQGAKETLKKMVFDHFHSDSSQDIAQYLRTKIAESRKAGNVDLDDIAKLLRECLKELKS